MRKIPLMILAILCVGLCLLAVSCSCEDEVADHEHQWDAGRIIKPSSKTEYGLIEYTCKLCSVKNNRVLAKQNHDHVFSMDWKSDRMAHWHACTVENCTVLNERDEHKWDEGEIIEEANQQTAGTKKFKCTVCGYEKTERYAATAMVDNIRWLKAFEREVFENVTVVYTRVQNGHTMSVTSRISDGKVEYTDEGGRVTVIDDEPGAFLGSYGIVRKFAAMETLYNSAKFDSTTRAYHINVNEIKGSVQFSDGKITALSIVSADGMVEQYTLSMYSRTTVE